MLVLHYAATTLGFLSCWTSANEIPATASASATAESSAASRTDTTLSVLFENLVDHTTPSRRLQFSAQCQPFADVWSSCFQNYGGRCGLSNDWTCAALVEECATCYEFLASNLERASTCTDTADAMCSHRSCCSICPGEEYALDQCVMEEGDCGCLDCINGCDYGTNNNPTAPLSGGIVPPQLLLGMVSVAGYLLAAANF